MRRWGFKSLPGRERILCKLIIALKQGQSNSQRGRRGTGARSGSAASGPSLDTTVNKSIIRAQKQARRMARQGKEWRQLLASLRSIGRYKLSDQIQSCGMLFPYQCSECDGQAARRGTTCKARLCPWCAQVRGESIARRLVPVVSKFDNPVLVTLTIKNGHDLAERNEHIRLSYRKLSMRKAWKSAFAGGFGFQETTYNPASGWHVHMHLLLDGSMPQAELSRLWHRCTGDSFIVDIRRVGKGDDTVKLEHACYEASKYACKLSDINGSPELVGQYLDAFHGRRMMWSFGHCFGLMTAIEADEKEAYKEADRIEREVRDGQERTCIHCGAVNGFERLVGAMWTHDVCIRSVNGWWVRGPSPGSLLE